MNGEEYRHEIEKLLKMVNDEATLKKVWTILIRQYSLREYK